LGLPGALLSRLLAGALSVVLVAVALRPAIEGPRGAYREELKIGGQTLLPMALFLSAMTVLTNFDRLFVRNFLLQDSGGYGAVVTLGMIPSYLIGPVVFVAFPLVSGLHAKQFDTAALRRKAVGFGLSITFACTLLFFLCGQVMLRTWQPAFSPYARCLWIYALSFGLQGCIAIVAQIEMGRHRYGFVGLMLVPVAAMCAFLYFRREVLSIDEVVAVGLLTRCVIFCATWLYSTLVPSCGSDWRG